MEQPGLFSENGKSKRDRAIEQVRSGKDEYISRASAVVGRLAATKMPFTTDHVVQITGKHEEGRVLGAVIMDAVRSGLIVATGRWVESVEESCNSRPKREWKGV